MYKLYNLYAGFVQNFDEVEWWETLSSCGERM